MPVAKNDVLDGAYRLTELLGRGGFGEVWAAQDLRARREISIKVLHDEVQRSPELVRRFQREVRALERIGASPHAIPLFAAQVDPGRQMYFVSSRLHGETLQARVGRERFLSFGEAAPILADVLRGLATLHAAGVVHRDVKPANIFLEARERGEVRGVLLDFGVAKIVAEGGGDDAGEILTAKGSTVGTLAYMSPEQVDGASEVTGASDLYSLGLVLFRSLTGRMPFEPSSPAELLAMKLDYPMPSLGDITGVRWPRAIERLLERFLARDPDRRFSTARAALTMLRGVIEEHPALVVPVTIDDDLGDLPDTTRG